MPVVDLQIFPLIECMLHDSSDPGLVSASRIVRAIIWSTRRSQDGKELTYVVFMNQLLRNIFKVSLAHLLESVANILLH